MTLEIARRASFVPIAVALFVIGNLSSSAFAQGSRQNQAESDTNRSSHLNSNLKFISPADCLPQGLTRRLKSPPGKIRLRELAALITKASGITCRVDVKGIEADNQSPDVELEIDAEIPLYAALNQAFDTQLDRKYGWRLKDGVLILTSREESRRYLVKTFDVGRLLKSDLDHENLIPFLYAETGESWFEIDKEGGILTLTGDLLIAWHSFETMIEIAQILKALEHPAQETYFVGVPADADVIRALNSAWSVDEGDVSLERALASWSSFSKVEIQMDDVVRECLKQTVTCRFSGIKSQAALEQLLRSAGVESPLFYPGQGRMQIFDVLEPLNQFIICDVRDLLVHMSADELILAFQHGTDGPWYDIDAEGGKLNVINDCLFIRQLPQGLEECVVLLRKIREHFAARNAEDLIDPQTVETRYYRLPEKEARELYRSLPRLVAPETWGKTQIELLTIDLIPVDPNAIPAKHLSWVDTVPKGGVLFGKPDDNVEPKKPANAICESHPATTVPNPNVTLIIRQTHAVHQQIDRFINELFYGQPNPTIDFLQSFGELPFRGGKLSEALTEKAASD